MLARIFEDSASVDAPPTYIVMPSDRIVLLLTFVARVMRRFLLAFSTVTGITVLASGSQFWLFKFACSRGGTGAQPA